MSRRASTGRTTSAARVVCLVASVTAALALGAAPAWAQVTPPGPPPGMGPDTTVGAGATMGITSLDGDLFTSIVIGTDLRFGKLGVGVGVPLRLRVYDAAPKSEGGLFSLREQDWDEPSDYLRVLRYVQWGQKGDRVYARAGMLSGSRIGHGTIINQYFNGLRPDHYKPGLDLGLDFGVGGGELMLNDVIGGEVIGVRLFARPFQIAGFGGPLLERLHVGVSGVTDLSAPRALRYDDNDTPNDPTDDTLRVVGDNEPRVRTEAVNFYGVDVGIDVINHETVRLTPYVDWNWTGLGNDVDAGYHLGVLASLRPARVFGIDARYEYRFFRGSYLPAYFNALYEVERFQYRPLAGRLAPKAQVQSVIGERWAQGHYMEANAHLFEAVRVIGVFELLDINDGGNVMVWVQLPQIARVQASAYYTKQGFGNVQEAFSLDNGTAVASVQYQLAGPLFVYASYMRQWHLADNPNAADFGEYETTNDYSAGVGVSFNF